jgi:hypothetical protein
MIQARNTHNQTMTHLEPSELLAVLRAAKRKGAREWGIVLLAYRVRVL